MLETNTGIILRSRKSGESDRMLHVLTSDDELLTLKYHGIRASQRRSQISIQPGNQVQIVFYRKAKEANVFSIKELSLQKETRIQGKYQDLQRLAAVLALVQASAEPSLSGLYGLCSGALETLESHSDSSETEWFSSLLGFLIVRIQKLQGVLGEVYQCSSCGQNFWDVERWPPDLWKSSLWNEPELDFLCEKCALQEGQLATRAHTLHAIWIYAAARMRFSSFEQSLSTFPTVSGPGNTASLLIRSIQHFLGPLKELRFVDSD